MEGLDFTGGFTCESRTPHNGLFTANLLCLMLTQFRPDKYRVLVDKKSGIFRAVGRKAQHPTKAEYYTVDTR